ncbi:cation diffusion facilitator family transporter [Rothia aerolata]|uniref:Cation transporter n=1 Tax=Rothia aerolata TaxID=1812262 RepID=A0A917ITY7_9MICC|nr:cation diffusion facilitator family transporter [Rothia aerolata]GGH61810.1 cation transporter [Rothia aerolata]
MSHSHSPGSHGHQHGHSHSHADGLGQRRLLAVMGIAWLICLVQLVGALLTGSLALLFDTVHVLTDALGVSAAWGAAKLAARPSSAKRTWGFKRVEVIAAMFQAAILLSVGIFVLITAVQRFFTPHEIPGVDVLIFGAVGLVGNIVMILVLLGGNRTNFNMRAAFLEVVNDALGSLAVVISAIVIATTGWYQADALVALFIGALIIPRTVKLLKETLDVLLESTPPDLDLPEIQKHLEALPQVVAVHDLHISRISSDLPVLTAHVIIHDECFITGGSGQVLRALQTCVSEHFEVSIKHATFQLEPESFRSAECADLP